MSRALPRRLAIDFDGTLVLHHYPEIGPEVPLAMEALRQLQGAGFSLYLWTVRDGESLAAAAAWCAERGVAFKGYNAIPGQRHFTSSPKLNVSLFIDDRGVGCPLLRHKGEPAVDWAQVWVHLGKVWPALQSISLV